MYSFIICFIALIASYFVYGKAIEKLAGVDETCETPAHRLEDGIDYVPLSKIKNFLIHFLNIAGLGPILELYRVHYSVRQHSYGLQWVQSLSDAFMISFQDSCPCEMTD